MHNLFTIRYKLILAVGIAVIGFTVLGIVSYSALKKLSETAALVERAQNTATTVSRTQRDIVKLSMQKAFLSVDQVDNFKNLITETNKNRTKDLQLSAQAINNHKLTELLIKLRKELELYMSELSDWLLQKQEFGLDENNGLLGGLRKAANILNEEIDGLPKADTIVSKIMGAEKAFLLHASSDQVKLVESYIKQLRSILAEWGYENEYAEIITAYKNAFLQVAEHLLKLRTTENALNKRISQVERSAISSVMLLDNEVIPITRASARTADSQARSALLLTASIAAVILIIVIIFVSLDINKGLKDTEQTLSMVSDGNLTARMNGYEKRKDEFGKLSNVVNHMASSLNNLVSNTSSTSDVMANMSDNLSTTMTRMVDTNHQITSQAHQVSSASEQMRTTVHEIALTTSEMNEMAAETSQAGTNCLQVMRNTKEAINDITRIVDEAVNTVRSLGESSERISMVVDVIDSLAAQTNLLALNAAIEAARAGESGRGFAVVADEVRGLAYQTTEATSKISEIVERVQHESKEAVTAMDLGQVAAVKGTELGSQAMESVGTIEHKTTQTADRTAHIATAIEQMSTTIHEISKSIKLVANEVEKNEQAALGISQTASVTAKKADDLKKLTGAFIINSELPDILWPITVND